MDTSNVAVATRMAVHGVERLPVVEGRHSLKLEGLVARSDLVKPFVGLFDEEHRFEAFQQGPIASALKAMFHRGRTGG